MRLLWSRTLTPLALSAVVLFAGVRNGAAQGVSPARLLPPVESAQPAEPRPLNLPGDILPVAATAPALDATLPPVVEAPVVPAPPAAPASDDLKARIDRLERQNQELLNTLKAMQAPSPVALQNQLPPAEGGGPREESSLSKNAVQKMVGEYLKDRDEKKTKDDEAKKKQEKEKGFVVGSQLGMTATWRHGLWMETADKAFRLHIGGRTQFDVVGVTAPNDVQFGPGGFGRYDDAVNFRRGRFAMEGTFWEVIDFNCEYDFFNTFDADPTDPAQVRDVNNTPVPTDMWVTFTHLPWIGNVRIGNHKPWIGFEHLTSSRFLNFMERSYQFDAFIEEGNNGFSPGISTFNNYGPDECGMWAVGMWKTTRSIYGWNVGDGEWSYVGRMTYLPVWRDEGRTMVHVGVGASWKDLDDDIARYRARTMLRNGPAVLHNVAAIARVRGEDETVLNPELVANLGPFTLQSEYIATWTGGVNEILATPIQRDVPVASRTYFAQGAYVEALYFLTGEHRLYNKKIGAFDRVIPYRNYYCVPGHCMGNIFQGGAWQVGARYSWLDLDNNGIFGGTINSFTAGLNWFLNPNFKIQWNYEYGHRTIVATPEGSGPYQEAGMRFAFDW